MGLLGPFSELKQMALSLGLAQISLGLTEVVQKRMKMATAEAVVHIDDKSLYRIERPLREDPRFSTVAAMFEAERW